MTSYVRELAGAPADPARLAEIVARAVGARACEVTSGTLKGSWGSDDGTWSDTPLIDFGGAVHGVLAVSPARIGALPKLAALLGPLCMVARHRDETDELRSSGDRAARALADGRWRAAVEMDNERRTLERDLHDGAQHHLVSLQMTVGLLEHALLTSGIDGVATRAADLAAKLDAAQERTALTAAGMLPAALVSGGLRTALTAELASQDAVTLDVAVGVGRYPADVEAAVYFICMECVNNSVKHAPGAPVRVVVREQAGAVHFEVADAGPGFDTPSRTSGLQNLLTRAQTAGGRAVIRSSAGKGTVVRGFIPVH